jgi:DNA-3-methyladenine glycosylase II
MPTKAKTKTPSAKTQSTKKPNYWEQACDELMKQDRIMRKLIPKYGDGILGSRGDAFTTLARSIVGQQISVAAAQSVWNRTLETLQHEVTPARVLKTKQEDLRASGLSNRKVEYIRDLADHFHHGRLHTEQWTKMDDEDLIKELSSIRGIGRWTAEMFLIFNLMRPNVLPLDDIGLIRAISINYFSGEPVSRHEAREVAANWAPWRTVATWYMWRSIDPIPVEY